MAREPHIPLFLWIAAAILVHLAGGESATHAVKVVEERVDVQRFADSVLTHVERETSPIEIALLDESVDDPNLPDDGSESDDVVPEPPDQLEEEEGNSEREEERKTEPPRKDDDVPPEEVEEPKEDPEKKAEPEEKKPEEKKPVVDPLEKQPTKPPQTLELPKRVAVQQHVKDKNQEDNPDAEFLAEDANHVKEQTRSTITSNDQNDPDPTPGSEHSGPTPEPGDSHVHDVAQSEDRAGDPDYAPGARGEVAETSRSAVQGAPGRTAVVQAAPPASPRVQPSQKGQTAQRATSEQQAIPNTLHAPGGTFVIPKEQQAQAAQKARKGRVKRLPPLKSHYHGLPRLAGGLDPNLSRTAALEVIGQDALSALQHADGERRRSKHRGSWHQVGIERWRSAIENYVASVKPGNQTALNTARSPFATYLNQIHGRLHPVFAGRYLGFLETLPADHPLNDMSMRTNLEIVLSKQDGSIVRMGVTRSSGSTMYDVQALEAVQRASPYGPPPGSIVSPDGNVYLHWEFHRNPMYACSTYFARPYMVNPGQKDAPPPPPERKPVPEDQREKPPANQTGQVQPPTARRSEARKG